MSVTGRVASRSLPITLCFFLSCSNLWTELVTLGSRFFFTLERLQQFVEVDDGDACGGVAHRVGKDQDSLVDHAAARVDDIRHITETLLSGRNEQRFAGLTDHSARVVMVQQGRANAVLAHRAHAVRQEQPAGLGFEG